MFKKLCFLAFLLGTMSVFGKGYGIVKNQSEVKFNVNKFAAGMMVPGSFSMFEGDISIEGNELKKMTGKIFVNSVNTGSAKRDSHLISGDFFASTNHPHILFQGSETKKFKLGKEFPYKGTLTIKGKTKPVDLKLTINKNKDNGYTVTGKTKINRYDFSINWNRRQDKKEESLLETISNFAKGLGDRYMLDSTVNIEVKFYMLPKA